MVNLSHGLQQPKYDDYNAFRISAICWYPRIFMWLEVKNMGDWGLEIEADTTAGHHDQSTDKEVGE